MTRDPLGTLESEIIPGARYSVTCVMNVADPSDKMAPALVAMVFHTPEGEVLTGPLDGIIISELYGHFLYAGKARQAGPMVQEVVFAAPEGAARVTLSLYRWRAGHVTLEAPLSLTLQALPEGLSQADDTADPAAGPDDHLLATLDQPVIAEVCYDVHAELTHVSADAARFALVAFRFWDASGARVDPPAELPLSETVGAYRYLTAQGSDPHADPAVVQAVTSVTIPAGATRMAADIVRWDADPRSTAARMTLRAINPPDRILAQGTQPLHLADWFVLSGTLRTAPHTRPDHGTEQALVRFVFTDAKGRELPDAATGLRRSDRFLNEAGISPRHTTPPTEGAQDIPFDLAFVPPEGAHQVSWSVIDTTQTPEDAAAGGQTVEGATLSPVPRHAQDMLHDLPLSAQHHTTLTLADVRMLRSGLPQSPLWHDIGCRRRHVLAEFALPVTPQGWHALHGHIPAAQGAPDPAYDMHVVWFDTKGQPLDVEALVGCTLTEALGLHRHVMRQNNGDFRVSFCAPERAGFALFYLLADQRGGRDADKDAGTATDLGHSAIAPAAALEGADIRHMTLAQLHQARDIAERIWHTPARRDIARTLSLLEPAKPEHAARAASLTGTLTELDPTWLPALPPARTAATDADPDTVLHLLKVICPDESSGGAVRSTATLEAQVGIGLRPVACMPLSAPRPADIAQTTPDGVIERMRNGVSVNYLHYPALVPKQISPSDQLRLETRLHDRVLKRTRASLIHAASGFRGYENALKGLALARANDLPLVYEVRSFHEHTWRPITATHMGDTLTDLRIAQENRCMAGSDAVVTISRAMVAQLAQRGIPQEQLFFVPNSISAEFETLAPLAQVAHLRHAHGLMGRKTLGYISNFSLREGHMVLLEAFAKLVAAGHDLHLVLVGEGGERRAVRKRAQKLGLENRVCLPGNVDHAQVKAWYRVIDLFVVPRIADFASDYVTPLKPFEAMSQNVPVLMSDRPVTAEIAGENEARAGVFAAGNVGALTAKIAAALADPDALAGRAARARDWVLNERTWAATVKRYVDVYAHARAHHASRSEDT